jgi:hypothetical protein
VVCRLRDQVEQNADVRVRSGSADSGSRSELYIHL